MKVLVVGSGGREHALCWQLAKSSLVSQIFVAPGNGGTTLEPKTQNVRIGAEDIDGLLGFALQKSIDTTIVGPEVPLTLGITDRFEEQGLRCFGPNQKAARLEGSKDFTKSFLTRHGIPTAQYQSFTDLSEACRYIDFCGAPIVVKADGLAAGKGVIVAETIETAKSAVTDMLSRGKFGSAGECVVIEQCLEGEEASFMCMVDGEDILPFATSQDHKTVYDGDRGPNTGGMGAYSPAPVIDTHLEARVMNEILRPTVQGLLQEGMRYTGFLYAGLMIDNDGNPNVLEFNCRLGDPETQPILMRLKSSLIELIDAALDQQLAAVTAKWETDASLGVVAAAEGYPGSIIKGTPILGLQSVTDENVKVFHAGTTKHDDSDFCVSGGRVLCVTALGEDIAAAQRCAYSALDQISFENMHYRTDIGKKALDRIASIP